MIVANRLPVRQIACDGACRWETSPGGLVAALAPILHARDGCWVGWPGVADVVPEPFVHDGIEQRPVPLSEKERDGFYYGFSNKTLWPLYHDAVRTPEFHRHWWRPYVAINRRFAEAAAAAAHPGDTVWVHDYQLQLVPGMLREMCPELRIGFFLHIPFPPQELLAQLPWRRQILEGLMGADLVGFQTRLGARNFSHAARRFAAAQGSSHRLEFRERSVQVGAFPISIDVRNYETLAAAPETRAGAEAIERELKGSRRIILGVDRLDYTKGIDIRLRAFETLLETNPALAKAFVFIQLAVPSREDVSDYADMRTRVEQLVGHINGTYGEPGMVPVQYLYRSLATRELVSYYVAADVMAVTPLRDGMNLVAKEYVATRLDDSGVLVLSEFAGAAKELRGALLVNPHDIDGVAAAFDAALQLPPAVAQRRMKTMRRIVRKHDVHSWATHFLDTLAR